MSLHPFFFQVPQFADSRRRTLGNNNFRIIGYSSYAEWTLVRWKVDVKAVGPKTKGQIYTLLEKGDFGEGETLYSGEPPNHRHIASAYYRLSFYEQPKRIQGATKVEGRQSVWDAPAWSAGSHGVPSSAAAALHDPNNYVAFDNGIEVEDFSETDKK